MTSDALRNIPASFAPDTVAEIDGRLDDVCRDHAVAIPLAVESGSRAWGFPSPDSDYDCRFIFVRPVDQHLSPWPRRDVIETPLEGDLDVNGWELGKALRLLLKGNAVVIEWLTSPIVYRGAGWFRDEMLAFAGRFADRDLIARHYLHLGERQRRAHLADGKSVPMKKMFYALRPAAALRWLRMHPTATVAPMNFATLIDACDPPPAVTALVADLIARKAVTREMGVEALPPVIADFLDVEFALAKEHVEGRFVAVSEIARREAERVFREVTLRVAS